MRKMILGASALPPEVPRKISMSSAQALAGSTTAVSISVSAMAFLRKGFMTVSYISSDEIARHGQIALVETARRSDGDVDVGDTVAIAVHAGGVGHGVAGSGDRVCRGRGELRTADYHCHRGLRGGERLLALLHVADDLQVALAERERADRQQRDQQQHDETHDHGRAALAVTEWGHGEFLPAGLLSRATE